MREKELVLLDLHNDAFSKSNKQLAFIECSQIYVTDVQGNCFILLKAWSVQRKQVTLSL